MSDAYFTPPSNASEAPVWELSGWWPRAGALIIDSLILYVPVGVIAGVALAIFGQGVPEDDSDAVAALIVVAGFVIGAIIWPSVYYCWMMSATDGQTVGKQALGIRVVREDGLPVDAWFAFKRQILAINILFGLILATFLSGLALLLDYLWPLWDSKNQALHDKIVSSRVTRVAQVSDPGQLQAAHAQFERNPYGGPTVTIPAPAPPQAWSPSDSPQFPQAPPDGAPQAAPPPPASSPPPPPPPAGTPAPYEPPPGFENPVPDDK